MSPSEPSQPVAGQSTGPGTLGIQVVVYQNPVPQLRRLAGAIAATVRVARTECGLTDVAVRWGDCSPEPVIDETGLAHLLEALEGAVDHVTYTFFDANLGSAGGSNELAKLGTEGRLWVLNPDTYPSPTCAAELLRAIDGPDVAAAEARQIPVEHPKAYDLATGDTGWASGACLMLDRSAFDGVGGFGARYFPLYCDDVDLSWRLRLSGHRAVHVPTAVVFHDKRPDADGGVRWSPHEARSSTLARLWLYRRYDRPDLEASLAETLERSDDPDQRSIAAEYRSMVASGDAPAVLDGASAVAEFVDGQYAPRRFEYTA
jgi:hypothetical protein